MKRRFVSSECEFSRAYEFELSSIHEECCVCVADDRHLKRSAAFLYEAHIRRAGYIFYPLCGTVRNRYRHIRRKIQLWNYLNGLLRGNSRNHYRNQS